MQKLPFMFTSFSLFAKQRERSEPKKEKARKRSLHFADAQCLNVIWAFSSNSFKAHYRTSCTFTWLTYVSNRLQFCVCVSTIAKPKKFCERSEQNVRPFGQSDASGSAEIFCVFFLFRFTFSFFLATKKKKWTNKLHNLCMWSIDAHIMGYVINYVTCTIVRSDFW